MKSRQTRGGFTLAEVLVTIAILATLAAVLLPALMGQISKGDATRTANDLVAVQTAISTFASDVKRYPSSVGHLVTAVTNSNLDVNGVAYPDGLASQWKGPYITKEPFGAPPNDSLRTGSGGAILGPFVKSNYNGIEYVTIQVKHLNTEAFNELDRIIDEIASSTTGRFVLSGADALYRAVPIQ